MAGDTEMQAHGAGLRRLVHEVRELALGDHTTYSAARLTVSPAQASALVADPALAEVRFACAAPGEAVRIVGPLDSVQPCSKGPGGGGVFPGFVGPAMPPGRGETHILRGAAVVAAGYLPRAQEAVIEMSGPAAALSPLSQTHNLVIEFEPAANAPWEDVEAAIRRGLLRVAVHLADAALDAEPDAVEELPGPGAGPVGRPRIGVLTNLQTQGRFKDVFVYGRSLSGGLPTAISPNELDDGAVVSGQYGHPALKNPTYLHQTHPVVAALRARDDVCLAALVLCPEPVGQAAKELISAHAARLCRALALDAVILTKEGGGNADADVALKMDMLEDEGIASVGIFAEMAGRDGTGPSLVVPPTRATAMVSAGNYDEVLHLPACDEAFGRRRVALLDLPATDALDLPVAAIYCALNPLGWGRLTCSEAA
ncbi:MAG TPA: glycine/sarcosine/betaine reductase component B subunit [Solirubrobacteraceae bacterium]|jgi:glycine reductase|nr:glycine/sarcosine/betaine reductase component B subunit [Solirubrobacteraceae bacterium]